MSPRSLRQYTVGRNRQGRRRQRQAWQQIQGCPALQGAFRRQDQVQIMERNDAEFARPSEAR
eukprot:7406066-Pyramimonas_sp.AAC.1